MEGIVVDNSEVLTNVTAISYHVPVILTVNTQAPDRCERARKLRNLDKTNIEEFNADLSKATFYYIFRASLLNEKIAIFNGIVLGLYSK